MDNHLKAIKIREKINDIRGLARSNLGIGSIYDFLGKKKLALEYKFKAKKLFEDASDTTYLAFTCNHIGKIYFDMGNIPEAEKYNMQALQLFIKKGNGTGMMDAFSLAGQIYYTKGEYTDAINNFESGLSWSRGFGLKDREISSLLDLSRVYTKKKEFHEAKKHLNDAMKLAGETGAKNSFK
ncbi:MAG: tetratricopeptide repeat protein [Sphingobacteriaceae bacterium]|nr:tetratricopeptide repeat protein [Sphingobacteriaceae bacterium]